MFFFVISKMRKKLINMKKRLDSYRLLFVRSDII